MLLAVFAVTAFGLSTGAASSYVVCSPVCGLVSSSDAQNLKVNQGKENAGKHISDQGATKNHAGVGQSGDSGDNNAGTVVLF